MHSLQGFIDPKEFKTYDELKSRLVRVLGEDDALGPVSTAESVSLDETVEARAPKSVPDPSSSDVDVSTGEEEDDTLSYFQKLASQS